MWRNLVRVEDENGLWEYRKSYVWSCSKIRSFFRLPSWGNEGYSESTTSPGSMSCSHCEGQFHDSLSEGVEAALQRKASVANMLDKYQDHYCFFAVSLTWQRTARLGY